MFLQFGTGKFLRAFVDLFVHELHNRGLAAGPIAVLQSTGRDREAQLTARGGRFHIAIRGWSGGELVDRVEEVASVSMALAAADDWPAVQTLAESPALELIVTNATEAGFALDPHDSPDTVPPRSFPAKLLDVLRRRHAARLPGLTILPCELLDDNAARLLALVEEQARRWEVPIKLIEWIREACQWRSTLVDRIVAAPRPGDPLAAEDPLLAVCEPYAAWLIEERLRGFRHARRCESPRASRSKDGRRAGSLRAPQGPPPQRRHTALVAKALPLGLVTVREAVDDPRVCPWLEALLFEEIVPVLEGRVDDPAGFARTALERFRNPFLDHRLADIALHHEVKLKTRLAPTLEEYRAKFYRAPKLLSEILGTS